MLAIRIVAYFEAYPFDSLDTAELLAYLFCNKNVHSILFPKVPGA